mgnify:CR=1 FL=1
MINYLYVYGMYISRTIVIKVLISGYAKEKTIKKLNQDNYQRILSFLNMYIPSIIYYVKYTYTWNPYIQNVWIFWHNQFIDVVALQMYCCLFLFNGSSSINELSNRPYLWVVHYTKSNFYTVFNMRTGYNIIDIQWCHGFYIRCLLRTRCPRMM